MFQNLPLSKGKKISWESGFYFLEDDLKKHFVSMVLLLASLWNRGLRTLENDLLKCFLPLLLLRKKMQAIHICIKWKLQRIVDNKYSSMDET